MKNFKVDKSSGKLVEINEKNMNNKSLSDSYKGFTMILNNKKSQVSNSLNIYEEGLFAIKY